MKQYFFLILVLLILDMPVYGQVQYMLPENKVWCFGEMAGLDFNSGSPVSFATKMRAPEGSSSVCDGQGQLLFYTFGRQVWDRAGNVMPNTLNGMPYFSHDAVQGSVIIPMPDSAGKFYLFSLESSLNHISGTDTIRGKGRFSYSIIDMSLNSGMGDVETGRKAIPLDSSLSESMIGVPGNRCNVWLIVHSLVHGLFYAYEITSSGLNMSPVISPSNLQITTVPIYTMDMRVSPDRSKLTISAGSAMGLSMGLKMYDFDYVTGRITNGVMIDEFWAPGACFSPDNSRLYLKNSNRDVYQYDLSSGVVATIRASKTLLARGRGLEGVYDLKIGPDGKIYTGDDKGREMSVIQFPNISGTACQYTPGGVMLPSGSNLSLRLNNEAAVFIRDPAPGRQVVPVCFRDSVLLQANPSGHSHLWDNGSTATGRMVYGSGTYVVSYVTFCKAHTDTFLVQFFKIPVIGFTGGCKGVQNNAAWVQPVAGDTVTYSYRWTDSSGNLLRSASGRGGDTLFNRTPGLYRVSLNGSNGCDTVLSVRIPPPGYQVSFEIDTGICIPKFLNTSTDDFIGWQWDFGDGSGSVLNSPEHRYGQPGTYRVRLIGQTQFSCYDTAYATVVIDSVPFVFFTMDKDSLCTGDAVVFSATYLSGAAALRWDFGDGERIDAAWNPVHSFEQSGVHAVSVTALYPGCPDTSFADTVWVFPYPIVNLGPDTALCPGPGSVWLSDLTEQPAGCQRRWSTGETAVGILVNQPGDYFLTVTPGYDCPATDSIKVLKSCYIGVPNVFTPNGDGYNDYFFPRQLLSAALTRFRMQLFNRWGQVIFETAEIDGRGWDGRVNGHDQPGGVYIYLIEAEFSNGMSERHQGNLTLIR